MPMQDTRKLLLVFPVSTRAKRELLSRAATVARRRNLDVIVYTPAIAPAAPYSDLSAVPAPEAAHETVERARRHADEAVTALAAEHVAATACVESQQSAIRGALARVRQERPALLMLSGSEYAAGVDAALAEGSLLERSPVPVWVVNSGRSGQAVLGALELDLSDPETTGLDERIVEEADRTAKSLDVASHVVHSLTNVPKFVEAALPGEVIDRVQQDREDEHVALAHALARRHDIALENVHIERGEVTEAVAGMAESVRASVVVIGATPRGSMSRLLFDSKPKRLLDRIRSDLLIVSRSPL